MHEALSVWSLPLILSTVLTAAAEHPAGAADTVPLHPFEAKLYFEGCLPVEEMARRGPKTLSFGPMKPVGLRDPRTGERPFAVVQLRQEDKRGVLYNLVGVQTKLRKGEQKRILRMIPGLENAEFLRYGQIHRNTYINAPALLAPTLQLTSHPHILFAGQISGVEGYVESMSTGLMAGWNAARLARGEAPLTWPRESAHGSLLRYVSGANPDNYQPANITFDLLPSLEPEEARKYKRDRRGRRARQCAIAQLGATLVARSVGSICVHGPPKGLNRGLPV